MARRASSSPKKAVSRVAGAAKKVVRKVAARGRSSKPAKPVEAKPATKKSKPRTQAATTRRRRAEPDIPLDVLNRTYTPKQTSLKAPFRATGAERQRDQELAGGFADERWNDEDRFTNKSGDPRIGTHGRRYEPGE